VNQKILQFRIILQGARPPIWRQIQISNTCTFWDLHVAIQDAMGWEDSHLHQFEVKNPKTGTPEYMGIPENEGCDECDTLGGWLFKVRDYVCNIKANQKILYLYDFGDHWEHSLQFEGEHSREAGVKYPICLAGERACPPEDVGGIPGYENYLEIMQDPLHEEHDEMLEWRGKFNSESFNPQKVRFDNPKKRLTHAFPEKVVD